jgi:hypothetical protein
LTQWARWIKSSNALTCDLHRRVLYKCVPTVWNSFGIMKKNSRALKRFGILWFLW